ncbi:MAG: hypothetical protein PHE87_10855, partial [Victivallaceae bacterium]|nr:hypothetical protein [Victivallaceae bacterium]
SSLEFVFNNKDNKPLVIYIPLLKYNTAELSAHDGADSDSLITVTFTGLKSETDNLITIDNPGCAEYTA